MKKVLTAVLLLTLALAVLTGCSPEQEEEVTYKLGLGTINSIAKSQDYNVEDGKETLATGQVDAVMAAVLFDEEGRVVNVSIDNGQTKVNFDAEMQVTSDKTAEYPTKVERGEDYGMKRVSEIGKEWYEQIAELENWMIGKTAEEIKNMDVKQRDEEHTAVPDVPELTSLVTITVEDYIAAVVEAYENSIEVTGVDSAGLGQNISISKSAGYDEENETLPLAQVDTVMAASAFDSEGKVVGTIIDTAQVKIQFDAEGKVTSDKTAEYPTKVELGDDYGMKRVSEIGKEWYEQIAELENWMAGKTTEEITSLDVEPRDDAHPAVPADPELTSLVTISVQDYLAAVEESYDNAKPVEEIE